MSSFVLAARRAVPYLLFHFFWKGDTHIPESPPPSSPTLSASQPLEDQFTALTLTPADDDNGGGEDGGDGVVDGEDGGAKEAVVVVETGIEEGDVKEEREVENENDDGITINSNDGDDGNIAKNSKVGSRFPVRPEAEVCTYYMRTGMCKFGMNCKFNHPPLRKPSQVGKIKGKDESVDKVAGNSNDSGEKEGRIDCKYFDRPGGCKFGKACKYNHNRKAPPTSELNFMGLPIRLGEKECPYYMRNGSCKFGASCRFNHPDPASIGAHDAFPSYNNGGAVSSPYASQSTLKSWSSPAALNESPPYGPLIIPPTQNVPSRPEWTAYPVPVFAPGGSVHMAPAHASNSKLLDGHIYTHQLDRTSIDEFPERPGQPECTYFLKTGDCKYRSACKFHHPKSTQVKSASCSLSDFGLPLRPGESICSFYSRYGICKYGPACKYDHPVNHAHSGTLNVSAVNLATGLGSIIVNNQAMAAGS